MVQVPTFGIRRLHFADLGVPPINAVQDNPGPMDGHVPEYLAAMEVWQSSQACHLALGDAEDGKSRAAAPPTHRLEPRTNAMRLGWISGRVAQAWPESRPPLTRVPKAPKMRRAAPTTPCAESLVRRAVGVVQWCSGAGVQTSARWRGGRSARCTLYLPCYPDRNPSTAPLGIWCHGDSSPETLK